MTYLYTGLALVIAYLLGSIPSAVWIGKRYYGIDVRQHGSHNAGSTNTLRVLGTKAALPVFLIDILKGFAAVMVMNSLHYLVPIAPPTLQILEIVAVFTAVLGHIFPIFASFKGGKGVATLLGAVVALSPAVVTIVFGCWLVIFIIWRYVSLASMVAGCIFPVVVALLPSSRGSLPLQIFSVVVALLLLVTHRKNIGRLLKGTESKTTFKKKDEQNK